MTSIIGSSACCGRLIVLGTDHCIDPDLETNIIIESHEMILVLCGPPGLMDNFFDPRASSADKIMLSPHPSFADLDVDLRILSLLALDS